MFSQICSNCQTKDSIFDDYENGETVCTNCGNILGENLILDEYEKRHFKGQENEVQRIGLPEKPGTDDNYEITLLVGGKTKNTKMPYTKENSKEAKKKEKIKIYSMRIESFCSKMEIQPVIIKRILYLCNILAQQQSLKGKNFEHIISYYYILINNRSILSCITSTKPS